AACGPLRGCAKQIFLVELEEASSHGKVSQTVRLSEGQGFESRADGGRQPRDQNQKNQRTKGREKAETRGTRPFSKSAGDFLLAEAVPGSVRKRAPAVARQLHR